MVVQTLGDSALKKEQNPYFRSKFCRCCQCVPVSHQTINIFYCRTHIRASPKVKPPILFCRLTMSEADGAGMAVEFGPSHQYYLMLMIGFNMLKCLKVCVGWVPQALKQCGAHCPSWLDCPATTTM